MISIVESRCLHLLRFGCLFAGLLLAISPAQGGDESAAEPLVSPFIWQQTSEEGLFDVLLDAQISNPAKDVVAINEFLEWILTVKTPDGEAVTPARITVAGGMPMHGHGLPSQPQVSEYLGEGRYLVQGLQFSMNGNWELAFDIQSKDLRDKVVFEFKLDY